MAPRTDHDAGTGVLAAAVAADLAAGLRLSAADAAFIVSAVGARLPEDLPSLVADPGEWGAEPVVALLFSADERSCRRLLGAVQASTAATEADIAAVIDAVAADTPAVTVYMTGDPAGVRLTVPADGIRRFVETLRPTQRIPEPWYTDLAAALPDEHRAPLLSRLRLSRVTWEPASAELLVRWCDAFGRAGDADDLLALLVDVLETDAAGDAEAALARRKRAAFRALNTFDRFTESACRHNMETLMLMGIRPPAVSADEARRQMNRIDRISMALFDRTEIIIPEALTVSRKDVDAAAVDRPDRG